MTPANYGMITYTAIGGEPVRGFGHYGFSGTLPYPPSGAQYIAGDLVAVWLDYGYTKLDKSVKDFSHTNTTFTGVSETLYFGNVVKYLMQLDTISDVRGLGLTEEALAFDFLIEAGLKGQTLTWYPSWTGSGSDASFQCALRKRHDPVRMGSDIHLWTYTIELEVLPTMTIPTVPAFV